ncbi:MAG TPA: radical SAM protein [Vicinamibacterales bacterium]|nr:radical SAM protein [Vicinamibacterales bacterium]
MFNLRVPLAGDDVFLMNTLTDAQLVVTRDVAELLDRVHAGGRPETDDERQAAHLLAEHGFIVPSREADRQSLERFLGDVKRDSAELHVTLLTTLQCNFACDYCYQGDHGDYNERADRMSLETAARVADWIERELDRVAPERLVVTFFGGEPLLNLPVMYMLAARVHAAATARGVRPVLNIVTNGLLLTPEVVDRMLPFGLNGVKITLDGDRDVHNRMRPLRGGQGTFDRIIENIRQVAGKCRIAVGGNFDESSVDSFPSLLEFLKSQAFADQLSRVFFKPIVRAEPVAAKGIIPLTPVPAASTKGVAAKDAFKGTCMTSVGSGAGKACDSCNVLDDKTTELRAHTRRLGFPTHDGVHNGPCHVHKEHAHTIGPDGSLYACPGFTGQLALSTGHIDDRRDSWRESALERFNRLHPWKECGDCAFIPVCAGGCVAASYSQLGDMNTPTCHKPTFESAVIALAHDVASKHADSPEVAA